MSNMSLSPRDEPSLPVHGQGARALAGGRPPALPPILNLVDVGRAVRRRWIVALASVVACTGLALYLAKTRTPRFTATAVLRVVDSRRELAGDLVDQRRTAELPNADPVLTQVQVLLSRATARKAIMRPGGGLLRLQSASIPLRCISSVRASPAGDSVHLEFDADHVVGTRGVHSASASYGAPLRLGDLEIVAGCRPPTRSGFVRVLALEPAIASLAQSITARPRQGTDVVDVSYTALDPTSAQRGVNLLVTAFQESNLEAMRRRSRQRREFVERQLVISEARFRTARDQLAAFRSRTPLLGSGAETGGALPALAIDRLQAEREVAAANALLARIDGPGRRTLPQIITAVADAGPLGAAAGQFGERLLALSRTRDSLMHTGMGMTSANRAIVALDAHVEEIRGLLVTAVRDRITAQRQRLGTLAQLESRELRVASAVPYAQAEEARLRAQEVIEQRLVEQLREEQQRAHIAEAAESGEIELVDLAARSAPASWPQNSHIVLFGIGLGVLVGASAAYAREQLDTSVRRRTDLDDHLAVPGLVVVPRLASIHDRAGAVRAAARLGGRGRRGLRVRGAMNGGADSALAALVALTDRDRRDAVAATPVDAEPWDGSDVRVDPLASLADAPGAMPTDEAFRHLRTGLLFAGVEGAPRTLAVTSALAAEGKTTVAINLAISLAEASARVLLIDGDIRNPQIHREFDGPMSPGLVDAVRGDVPAIDLVRETGVAGLSILPAGRARTERGELLPGAALRRLLGELSERFDVIVIDAPPVLPSAAASVIAAVCDGVLFVVRAGRTEQADGRDALDRLRRVGAHVLGAVLNDPDRCAIEQTHSYYAYSGSDDGRVN